ncbi:MAG: hypothetical protein KCHDKBKB_02219 [Elusimicrobia bacterium]|nr:hypothetical protein [Elusimicrobiota bacterium]
MLKKIRKSKLGIRSTAVFVMAGFLIVGMGGATIVGPIFPEPARQVTLDPVATKTMQELVRLGLHKKLSQAELENFLSVQSHSQKPLSEILKDPLWLEKLGLSAKTFKATWYAANPFELLPLDLQTAIRKEKTPFQSRSDINLWLKRTHAPKRWVKAIELALIETTAKNLWRASRGKRPYAKNGQYLQPIALDRGNGHIDTMDGHIATDPRVIPTNSKVLILVRINGEDRLLRVKASDIGQAIKGHHVDLPIVIKPKYGKNHAIRFPGESIRNPTVIIFSPAKKSSRGQKA